MLVIKTQKLAATHLMQLSLSLVLSQRRVVRQEADCSLLRGHKPEKHAMVK
jgi:hypothetical protein